MSRFLKISNSISYIKHDIVRCFLFCLNGFFVLLLFGEGLISCGSPMLLTSQNNLPNKMPDRISLQTTPYPQQPYLIFEPSFDYGSAGGIIQPSSSNIEEILGFNIDNSDDRVFLSEVASWVGVPYRHAHHDKSGTDCSGFSYAIYKKLYNKNLDRTSDGQFLNNCKRVSKNKIRQGDLLFFAINNSNKISHVGIYLKDDKFIHASSVRGVIVSSLNDDYYKKYFYAAGRVK